MAVSDPMSQSGSDIATRLCDSGEKKKGVHMRTLILALLFSSVGAADKIQLTPDEERKLEKLPDAEQIFVRGVLNGTKPTVMDDRFVVPQPGNICVCPTPEVKVIRIKGTESFYASVQTGTKYMCEVRIDGISTTKTNVTDFSIFGGARGDLTLPSQFFVCTGRENFAPGLLGTTREIARVRVVGLKEGMDFLRSVASDRDLRVWGEGSSNLVIAKYVRASSKMLYVRIDGDQKVVKLSELTPIDSAWVKEEKKRRLQERRDKQKQ